MFIYLYLFVHITCTLEKHSLFVCFLVGHFVVFINVAGICLCSRVVQAPEDDSFC